MDPSYNKTGKNNILANTQPLNQRQAPVDNSVKGYLFNKLIAPAKEAVIDPDRIQAINNSPWTALIYDLSTFVVKDVAGMTPDQTSVKNMSALTKKVLLALATIRGADVKPIELDDLNFGRRLVANILGVLLNQNLTSYDPESQALKAKLAELFDTLIENAGLDQEGIKSHSFAIGQAFYPSRPAAFLMAAVGIFANMPQGLDHDAVKAQFIDAGIEMCRIQQRLVAQSENPILNAHTDASKLAEYVVKELVLPRIKGGELPLDLWFLSDEKNKEFLQSIINEVLSENEEIKLSIQEAVTKALEDVPSEKGVDVDYRQIVNIALIYLIKTQDSLLDRGDKELVADAVLDKIASSNALATPLFFDGQVKFLSDLIFNSLPKKTQLENDRFVIAQLLEIAEDQLNMCLKAIFAAVLKETKPDETAEARRNSLVDGILNRIVANYSHFRKKLHRIDLLSDVALISELERLETEKTNTKAVKVQVLLQRSTTSWEQEALAFYEMAWDSEKANASKAQKIVLTREELISELKTWETEKKINPCWKVSDGEMAKDLLAREGVTWQNEVRKFLKTIAAEQLAREMLKDELSSTKFALFFPKTISPDEVFNHIYQNLGEQILELHEHMEDLKQKGIEADNYIKRTNVSGLTDLMDNLLLLSITAIEKKAQFKEIDLGFAFLSDMAAHLLDKTAEGEDVAEGKKAAKNEVKELIENILKLVIADTIKRNAKGNILIENADLSLENIEGSSEGIEIANAADQIESAEAFANFVDNLIIDAMSGVEEVSRQVIKFKEMDFLAQKEAINEMANALGVKKIKFENSAANVDDLYKNLLLKSLARKLTASILPVELFNSLVPPVLRRFDLWKIISDELLMPYISGVFDKISAFRLATEQTNSQEASKLILSPQEKEAFGPLIDELVKTVNEKLPTIEFASLLKEEGSSLDFSVLDKLFGKAFGKEGQIATLVQRGLPRIVESILAFHFNSYDGESSQDHATELLWVILQTADKSFKTIETMREAWNAMDEKDPFFANYVTKMDIEAYRNEMKIDSTYPMSNELLKECYLWVQTNLLLKDTLGELVDVIVPESLWESCVPEQFAALFPRSQIGGLFVKYLSDGYQHSIKMRELVSMGKKTISQQDQCEWHGLNSYLEEKIRGVLQEVINPEDSDIVGVVWMKRVFGNLMEKEDRNTKPFTDVVVSGVFAVLGKLMSGGLAALNKTKVFMDASSLYESEIAKTTLIDNLSQLIPEIRESFYRLNDLNAEQDTSSFVELSQDMLGRYFPVAGINLGKNEQIEAFLPKFATSLDGKVVLELVIKNIKTQNERKITLDVYNFVHWTIGYKVIDVLIPEEDWNELVPEFFRKHITKELFAGFATSYIADLHAVQKPLQNKAERGGALVNAVNVAMKPLNQRLDQNNRTLQGLDLELAASRKSELVGKKHSVSERYGIIDSEQHEKVLMTKTDLKHFVDEVIVKKVCESLNELAENENKLSVNLPDFLDKLLKQILQTNKDVNIKELREILVERAVYMFFSELLRPAKVDFTTGAVISAAEASVHSIKAKLIAIIKESKRVKGDYKKLAQKIVDEFLPAASWNEIFIGNFRDLMTRTLVVEQVEKFLALGDFDVPDCPKINVTDAIQSKWDQAAEEIKALDADIRKKEKAAGLPLAQGGGLEEMVKVICDSIEETIVEFAANEEPIFQLPPLFNDLAKELFKDPDSSKVVKDSLRALVTICVARLFKTQPNQLQRERLFELLGNLIKSYDPENPQLMAEKWIEELFPDDLRREILPKAVYKIFNPKFMAETFVKDLVLELDVVVKSFAEVPNDDADHNVSRLQTFVKKTLSQHQDARFARDGLSGMGGFVKALEGVLIGAMAGRFQGEGAVVGSAMESILDNVIAKVLESPKVQPLLNKRFMAEAMSAALPKLGNCLPPEGFTELTAAELNDLSEKGLKELGIDIRQDVEGGETDAQFKQRVINRHFELASGKKISSILFPRGVRDVPAPEKAKEAVLRQVNEALANQVGRVTNREERILMAIDVFGVAEADKVSFNALRDHLKSKRNLIGREQIAENLFKEGLTSFAMKKIEEKVVPHWIQPFRWLVQSFVKVVAWIALKVAINQQVWNFVSSADADLKLRSFIWSLLSFASNYKSSDSLENDEDVEKELAVNLTKALDDIGLLYGLQNFLGPVIGGGLKGKNFVDLVV